MTICSPVKKLKMPGQASKASKAFLSMFYEARRRDLKKPANLGLALPFTPLAIQIKPQAFPYSTVILGNFALRLRSKYSLLRMSRLASFPICSDLALSTPMHVQPATFRGILSPQLSRELIAVLPMPKQAWAKSKTSTLSRKPVCYTAQAPLVTRRNNARFD